MDKVKIIAVGAGIVFAANYIQSQATAYAAANNPSWLPPGGTLTNNVGVLAGGLVALGLHMAKVL